jgi:hypothetical protein
MQGPQAAADGPQLAREAPAKMPALRGRARQAPELLSWAAMEAGGSTADAHEGAHAPAVVLPIVGRIARAPKVDFDAIFWPLERVARTPRGRSAGRVLIAGVFILVLAAFAGFNVRGATDEQESTAMIPHAVTPSVHAHRGLAGFHHLEVVSGARSPAAVPGSTGPPRVPSGP